jgi:hypothetical protein
MDSNFCSIACSLLRFRLLTAVGAHPQLGRCHPFLASAKGRVSEGNGGEEGERRTVMSGLSCVPRSEHWKEVSRIIVGEA